jgi:predicted small lipoprotein YifL
MHALVGATEVAMAYGNFFPQPVATSVAPTGRGLVLRIPSNRHDGYTARMNRRLALASAVFAIVLPALSGCGNKGPLVLSDAPAETPVPAEASAPEATPAPDATTPAAPPASGTPAR